MSQKLAGKVAIVTGASKGIGASIATHLAAEGAAVVVNYASSKEAAERLVAEIAGKGGKAVAIQADIAKPADVAQLFSDAKKAFGRLDILINNAGVYEFQPLESVTPEHFHKMFDLNVLGLILASREAVKYFDSAGGCIVNVSSVAATSVYSATKAAVDAVTRSLAKELGPRHPRQLDQPRYGRHGRAPCRRDGPRRFSPAGRIADSAGAHRSSRRHCARRCFPRLARRRLDHRRNSLRFRRTALTQL